MFLVKIYKQYRYLKKKFKNLIYISICIILWSLTKLCWDNFFKKYKIKIILLKLKIKNMKCEKIKNDKLKNYL